MFLHSVYLSVALQSKKDCFSVGLINLDPVLTDSTLGSTPASALATATTCTTAFAASVIDWCWVHCTITGNRFFLYLNTKLKYLFACQNVAYIYQSSFRKIHNVTVHIK